MFLAVYVFSVPLILPTSDRLLQENDSWDIDHHLRHRPNIIMNPMFPIDFIMMTLLDRRSDPDHFHKLALRNHLSRITFPSTVETKSIKKGDNVIASSNTSITLDLDALQNAYRKLLSNNSNPKYLADIQNTKMALILKDATIHDYAVVHLGFTNPSFDRWVQAQNRCGWVIWGFGIHNTRWIVFFDHCGQRIFKYCYDDC